MSDFHLASVIVILAFGVLVVAIPASIKQLRAQRARVNVERERERFRTHPRVGDRAGYQIKGRTWMVGEVAYAGRDGLVSLDVPYFTATGTQIRTRTIPPGDLRWFPPDTPLGLWTEPEAKQEGES